MNDQEQKQTNISPQSDAENKTELNDEELKKVSGGIGSATGGAGAGKAAVILVE